MAISLKHTFQSAKSDGADTTLVQPSNWNAEHIITAAAGKVLGRDTSGAGAVQELPIAVNSSGNVGIGTSSPGAPYKLDVAGAVRSTAGAGFSINANNPDFRMVTTDGRGWRMGATSSGTNLGNFYIQGTTDNFTTSFIIGPTIDSAGNVGVGTTNPQVALQVVGAVRAGAGPTDATNTAVAVQSDGAVALIEAFQGNNSSIKRNIGLATYGGNVGIGTGSPSYQLQLSTNSAAKPTSNVWTVASDERVKTVTGEYTKGLDAVCSLRPVTYKYNGKAGFVADGSENISIIAQEAMEAFPECIGTFSAKLNETDEEETELLNWDGHALTFALVNAIKELRAQNEDLRTRLAAVEGAIA